MASPYSVFCVYEQISKILFDFSVLSSQFLFISLQGPTCERHLHGRPVDDQHVISAIITGLDVKLFRGHVPEQGGEMERKY